MVHNLRVFWAFYLVGLRTLREFRVNWTMGFLKIPVVLALQILLWKTIFNFSTENPNGFSFEQIIIYYVGLSFISISCSYPAADKIQTDIQKGNLAVHLARPVYYLAVKYAEFMAHWSVSVLISVVVMGLVSTFLGSGLSPFSMLLLLVSLILSSVVYFLFEVIMGLMAIWMYRILGLKLLLLTVFDVLGGKIFPVDFLPESIRWLSYLTPWRSVFYEPLMYLNGQSDLAGLGVQLISAGVLLFVALVLWRSGAAKYDGGV